MKKASILLVLLLSLTIGYSQDLLVSEDFDGSTLPEDWSQFNNGGGTQLWTFGSGIIPGPSIDFPTNAAIFNDDISGDTGLNDSVSLISPGVDVTAYDYLEINYEVALQVANNDFLKIYLFDEINTEILIDEYTLTIDPTPVSFNITIDEIQNVEPAFNFTSFHLLFLYSDVDSDWAWGAGIDNVELYGHTTTVTPNDDAANAQSISCGDDISANNAGATLMEFVEDCDETPENQSMDPGLWYQFVGDGSLVTISTCNQADFDTQIGLYSGTSGNLVCEVGNDDGNTICNLTSEIEDFPTQNGSLYYIKVAGYGGAIGNFTLSMSCQTVSIADKVIQGFEIYPNPVENKLHLSARKHIDKVCIYNILGERELICNPEKTQVDINTTLLQPGFYIVKVQIGKQIRSYQLVKE